MKFYQDKKFLLYGFLLTLIFLFGNGNVHLFDWDEINFAECAREMCVTGNFFYPQIGFQPFYEKPPLFLWLQSLCMAMLGISEAAARFPDVVAGIITWILLYRRSKRMGYASESLGWPVLYMAGFLPVMYFKSGIIDPWFNLFIFLALLKGYDFNKEAKPLQLFLSAVFLSLAVMTKGPVAWLLAIVPLSIFWFLQKKSFLQVVRNTGLLLLISLIIPGFYFIILFISGNREFLPEFIKYQIRLFSTEDSGHGGPFWFHLPVLLLGCFPASFFAIRALFFMKEQRDNKDSSFSILMLLALCWTILIFSVVRTKIVHYSSFSYYPMSWLAFQGWLSLKDKHFFSKIEKFFWILLNMLIFIVLISALLLSKVIHGLKNYIPDEFILQNMQFLGEDSMIFLTTGISFVLLLFVILVIDFRHKRITFFSLMLYPVIFFLVMIFTIPRIEILSQRGYIELVKSFSDEKFYLETIDFKSYAYYFYGKRMPVHYSPENIKQVNDMQGTYASFSHRYATWLLSGKSGKSAILFYKGKVSENPSEVFRNTRIIQSRFGYDLILKFPEKNTGMTKSQ